MIYERPDQKEWLFGAAATSDGRYLIINVNEGTDVKTRVYYKDLTMKDEGAEPAVERRQDRQRIGVHQEISGETQPTDRNDDRDN